MEIGHQKFNLSVSEAGNLVNSAYGMKPYSPSTGWGTFPERNADQWGIAFRPNLTINEDTFVKSKTPAANMPDSTVGINYKEKGLAAQQLTWDMQTTNDPSLKEKLANASSFINQLFWGQIGADKEGQIREGLDTNNNGIFDKQDIKRIATLDGDSSNISNRDFDIAFENYRNGINPFQN